MPVNEPVHIVNLSGGKDSTAMLLLMLEKGYPIDEIIFCDTGLEFPEMYDHLDKIEAIAGVHITRLEPVNTFEYYLFNHVKTRGRHTNHTGYGWPTPVGRWCTRVFKTDRIKKYLETKYPGREVIHYIGYAFDEFKRIKRMTEFNKKRNSCYPLVEHRITEQEALQMCYDAGFDWDGLYRKFKRVSCWCCPFQSIPEKWLLYNFYPEKWNRLAEWDEKTCNKFTDRYSISDLSKIFEEVASCL